jgi:ParB family chromosome partitioning protein
MAARVKPVFRMDRAQNDVQASEASIIQTDAERALLGALSVPIEMVQPDPNQPRKTRDPSRLTELAASISEHGILQPLVVREFGLLEDGRTRYMIVAGERRYAAAMQAGLTRLPVVVRESSGAALRVLQLTENMQREDLDPVDEARALRELMDLEDLDTRKVGERLHRSHAYVADRLKLIAHEDVAEAVHGGILAVSAATAVAREDDPAVRQDLIARAKTARLGRPEVQRLRRERLHRQEAATTTPPAPEDTVGVAPGVSSTEHQPGATLLKTAPEEESLADVLLSVDGPANARRLLAWGARRGHLCSTLERIIADTCAG